MDNFTNRKEELHHMLKILTKENIAVAFSGGVDSSLLLKLAAKYARENDTEVYAVTANTELHPSGDVEIAKNLAEEMGARHVVVSVNELDEADIRQNPVDRCYRCKRFLFSKIKTQMEMKGVRTILDGTNADDMKVYRPGIKALGELGIISPLKDAKFTKEEVRRTATEYGVSVAERPSTPCLATRFPYGAELTLKNIKNVEIAESFLKIMGFYNLRVRVHGEIARIEVDNKDMELLLDKKTEIIRYLKKLGYTYITLDLEGFRSGSMDVHIEK